MIRFLIRGAAGSALALLVAGCSTLPGWMVLQGRAEITDHQHFENAPVLRAAVPSPLPSAPAALRWPGGLSATQAESLLMEQGTTALLVLRRGQLVHERYFNGHTRETLGTSFSMAKSVVSALVGIALEEGRIASVQDPITRYLPELRANDPRFERITLEHLLRMRSGIAFSERYDVPWSEAARFYLSPLLRGEVAALRIESEPNQAYRYKSGDTQLLAMALERAVGMPLARYLQERIWQPMGAEFDASWSLDSAAGGVPRGFCCLNARAVDYLRLGSLFLNGGRVGDKVVVPADWVRTSTAAAGDLPGADDDARRNIERARSARAAAFYAYQWRRAPLPDARAGSTPQPGDDFYAQGYHGQVLYVAPATQTVVLRLGRRNGAVFWPRWAGELARLNP